MINGNHHTRGQQAAMFFAGIATWETLGHWWLGTVGRDALPIKVGQWNFGVEANWVAMTAWPIILAALVWYAWLRPARMPAL
jgi:hypothetical protein